MNKILSYNLCLGLSNKIDLARKWIAKLDLDVVFFTEAEIGKSTNIDLLAIKNYNLMPGQNIIEKSKKVCYLKQSIKCKTSICEKTEAIS